MEKEINTYQLRQMLSKLSSELQIPFLQKRRQSQSHHENPLDQLREVVMKITQRERDLHAAIGISNILIDSNQELNQKIHQLTTSKTRKKEEIGMLKSELTYTKQDLYQSQEKYTQITKSLVATQQENLVLASENKRFQIEFSRILGKSEQTEQYQKKQYENQLESLNKKFQDQFINMKTLKQKLQSEKSDLQKQITELTQKSDKLEQQNKKLNFSFQKLSVQQTNSNNFLSQLQIRQSQLTNSLAQLQKSHKLALKKIESLEDELHLKENSTFLTSTKQQSADLSLMDQLKCLDSDFQLFKVTSNLQTISNIGTFSLPSRIDTQRKDPCEEYFILATQSVKVNSPYMDAICTVSTQMLYKKALLLEIPFHKWYTWIEDELNATYIEMLYKKGIKSKKQNSRKSLRIRQSYL